MSKANHVCRFLEMGIIAGIAIVFQANYSCAQISGDRTLSTNVQLNNNTFNITGGTQRNGNLFHSFTEFSIPTNRQAFFQNSANIQNIISRVTGSSISNIDGVIRANGTANLFLINPNSIIFGRNARLNLGGSFLASTASSVNFADGTQLTTNPTVPPLLTASIPIGLQFGANAGGIVVQGNGRGLRNSNSPVIDTNNALRVQPNQTLALVGGDITLEGGTLKTAGGRIELGSVNGVGVVSLSPSEKGWSLGYEGISNLGNIQLLRATSVDASGLSSGGEIQIQGKQITVQGGSQIEATTLGTGTGGRLTINAAELIEITGTTADNPGDNRRNPSSLGTDNRGAGNIPGELTLNTRRLIIRNGGRVSASNSGSGTGGNITVNAADSVELTGTFNSPGRGLRSSGLSVQTRGSGNAGRLTINSRNLTIQDGAEVSASTFGAGDGGNIEINTDTVELIGRNGELRSRIIAEVGNNLNEVDRDAASVPVTGRGGNLNIRTRQLTLRDGATVTVNSRSDDPNAQRAGSLNVTSDRIFLDNQGQITATTALGQGGDIILQVRELLLLRRNSFISTTAGQAQASGDGGNITINTPNGFIVAVSNENNDITANAFTGRGGQIEINTLGLFGIQPSSRLTPASDITAFSERGITGEIEINLPDIEQHLGVIELPTAVVDASGLINTSCTAIATQVAVTNMDSNSATSKLVITGRGGLPPTPEDTLNADVIWSDLRTLPTSTQRITNKPSIRPQLQSNLQEITPATNWVFNDKGEVTLISHVSAANNVASSPTNCLK